MTELDYLESINEELITIRGQVVEINGNMIDMTTEIEKVNMILESGDRKLEEINQTQVAQIHQIIGIEAGILLGIIFAYIVRSWK